MKIDSTITAMLLLASSLTSIAKIPAVHLTKKNDLAKFLVGAVFEGESTAPEVVPIQGDPDGGDGAADGCVKINSLATGGVFGATAKLGTVDAVDKTISITTHLFNKNNSFIKYSVQIYNATDKRVVASFPMDMFNPKKETTEKTVKLEYKTTAEDKGDAIELRWVQHSTDSTSRDLYVDNVKVEVK